MRCHLSLASPHCVEQVLSCMNDDTTVVAGIRCSINRPLFLSIVAVHVLLGSGSAATEARQPPGNDSEDINARSGGKPISHLRQSRLAPSFEVRPCAVTTQGRFVHGGLCRTCWSCPHASSATQSFSLSRWKPTMGCSKICEPRACHFSVINTPSPRRSAGSLWAIARMCPSVRRLRLQIGRRSRGPQIDALGFRTDIYVEVNFRVPVSADRMWTLRMQ